MRTLPRLFLILATLCLTVGFGDRQKLLAPGTTALASSAASQEDDHAAIVAALQQIQRGQSVNRVVSRGPSPDASSSQVSAAIPIPRPRPTDLATACADCGPKLADVRYASCTSKNNYMEDDLTRLQGGSGLLASLVRNGPRANTVIKPICMRMGLETRIGANTRTFRMCEPGQAKAANSIVRPCISEKYFALVNNSFDLVSRCMAPALSSDRAAQQKDIRSIYAMLNVESGQHVNVVSPTGAAGVGQFTYDAIASVNRNDLPRVRRLLESQGGDCARLSKEILKGDTPMRPQVSRSCDRISLEKGNPLLNLVYTYAYITAAKKDLNDDLFQNRRWSKFFQGLSENDKNRLRTELTIWSHNTGMGGLRTPLNALLNSAYRGKSVTNVDRFLRELSEAMKDYPHSANRSRGRRAETSKYWPAIQQSLEKIEKNAGGGSCVR